MRKIIIEDENGKRTELEADIYMLVGMKKGKGGEKDGMINHAVFECEGGVKESILDPIMVCAAAENVIRDVMRAAKSAVEYIGIEIDIDKLMAAAMDVEKEIENAE